MITNITNYFSHSTEKTFRPVFFSFFFFKFIFFLFFCSSTFCRHPPRSGACRPGPIGPNGQSATDRLSHLFTDRHTRLMGQGRRVDSTVSVAFCPQQAIRSVAQRERVKNFCDPTVLVIVNLTQLSREYVGGETATNRALASTGERKNVGCRWP